MVVCKSCGVVVGKKNCGGRGSGMMWNAEEVEQEREKKNLSFIHYLERKLGFIFSGGKK